VGLQGIEIAFTPGVRWHTVSAAAPARCGGIQRVFWAIDDRQAGERWVEELQKIALDATTMTEVVDTVAMILGHRPVAFVGSGRMCLCCPSERGDVKPKENERAWKTSEYTSDDIDVARAR
jgi:hypothetical protein